MPRRTKNAEVAAIENTIEAHVAGRIRLRRGLLGMSQSDLARALGITFQQVQKYERGSNRVSVGKLFRLAEILEVPLHFFFDGLESTTGGKAVATAGFAEGPAAPVLSRRDLDLLRVWRNAPSGVADAIGSLLRAVSNEDVEAATVEKPAKSRTRQTATATDDSSPRRRKRGAVWDPADMYRTPRGPGRR